VTEIREPVEKWKELGRLEQFYADPVRRSYQFQTRAFHDRVAEAQEKYRLYSDTTDVFILERSIFTDKLFLEMLKDTGCEDQSEYEDYLDLWTMWEKVMPFRPDLFVYLRPAVDVCMARLRSRARDEEQGVSADYQQRLQEKHDAFFGGEYVVINECHCTPRLLLETNDNFKHDPQVQAQLTDAVEEVIAGIRSKESGATRSVAVGLANPVNPEPGSISVGNGPIQAVPGSAVIGNGSTLSTPIGASSANLLLSGSLMLAAALAIWKLSK
jgi:deoxyadenosine/deoxycytidine kinase